MYVGFRLSRLLIARPTTLLVVNSVPKVSKQAPIAVNHFGAIFAVPVFFFWAIIYPSTKFDKNPRYILISAKL